jgi:hypothetical protein
MADNARRIADARLKIYEHRRMISLAKDRGDREKHEKQIAYLEAMVKKWEAGQ